MTKWIETERPDLRFEDTSVGQLKKKIWDSSDAEIDQILEDYGVPTPSELAKPGVYVQNTIRQKVVRAIRGWGRGGLSRWAGDAERS